MKTQITHVLDTSALIAHYQEESGFEEVEKIVADQNNRVIISSVTWLEFHVRLGQICSDQSERRRAIEIYRTLLGQGIPADDAIASRAQLLRQTAATRLPNMDALIAATAAEHGAILVHRDPHMAGIPTSVVAQFVLPEK